MTAKAKKIKTQAERVKSIRKDAKTSYAVGRQLARGVQDRSAIGGGLGTSSVVDTQGQFLKTAGDTMIGPIAFFPFLTSISSDILDIDEVTGAFSSNVIVDTETGLTDDLTTIAGAKHAGQIIFLQGVATKTITLKTTGNITPLGGTDFDLIDDNTILLKYSATADKWQQLTGGLAGDASQWSTFPAISDVDLAFNALLNIGTDTIGTLAVITDLETATDELMVLDVSAGVIKKMIPDDLPSGAGDNLGDHIATDNLDMFGFDILNTGDVIPTDDGVADIGTATKSYNIVSADMIAFRHNNGILSTIPSIGRSDSDLRLNVPSGNDIELEVGGTDEYVFTPTQFQLKNLNSIVFLDGSDNQDVRIEYLDPSFNIINTVGNIILQSNSTTPLIILRGLNQTGNLLAPTIQWNARNSTPIDHEYANMKVRIGTATAGSEDGEWSVALTEGGVEDSTYIRADATTGVRKIFFFRDIDLASTQNDIILASGFNNSKVLFDGGGDTYFTGSGTSGTINIVNDGTNVCRFRNTGFEMIGGDILLGGGSKKLKSNSSAEIGIQVGNESLTIGTEGSIISPYFQDTVYPTNAATETDFGNVDGGMGIQHDTNLGGTQDARLVFRAGGVWYEVVGTKI